MYHFTVDFLKEHILKYY